MPPWKCAVVCYLLLQITPGSLTVGRSKQIIVMAAFTWRIVQADGLVSVVSLKQGTVCLLHALTVS